MKIEVKDLLAGDEIIIPSNSSLKYVKVLASPVTHPVKKHYKTKDPLYKSVRCSIKGTVSVLPVTSWRKKEGKQYTYEFETDSTLHNCRISLDLNYRDLWLVKRDYI